MPKELNQTLVQYLEKTGQVEVAKLYKNNPDEFPKEFNVDEAAEALRENYEALVTSSETYKTKLGESGIMTEKKFKKEFAKTFGLELSGEEATKKTEAELFKMAQDKIDARVEEVKNGRTGEHVDKYNKLEKSYKELESKYDTETGKLMEKVKEAESRSEKKELELARETVLMDSLSKLEFPPKATKEEKENAFELIRLNIQKKNITWDPKDRTTKINDTDPVFAADTVTRLNTIDDVVKNIATEKKLIPQSNDPGRRSDPGPGGNGERPKHVDPAADQIIQSTLNHVEDVNKGNFAE